MLAFNPWDILTYGVNKNEYNILVQIVYGYSLLNFHWRYNNQYTVVALLLGYSSFSAASLS